MPMPSGSSGRIAALLAGSLLVSACNTTQPRPATVPATASPSGAVAGGQVPDYCPAASLREGTGVVRRGEGEDVRYAATITNVSRSCRVLDAQLFIEVAVTGRMVPGNAAEPGLVNLPIRVAILDGDRLVYSRLGQQPVSGERAGGPKDFRYVDRDIKLPVPAGRTLTVFVGFDEGPPAARRGS